jgi:hypothetical protein
MRQIIGRAYKKFTPAGCEKSIILADRRFFFIICAARLNHRFAPSGTTLSPGGDIFPTERKAVLRMRASMFSLVRHNF